MALLLLARLVTMPHAAGSGSCGGNNGGPASADNGVSAAGADVVDAATTAAAVDNVGDAAGICSAATGEQGGPCVAAGDTVPANATSGGSCGGDNKNPGSDAYGTVVADTGVDIASGIGDDDSTANGAGADSDCAATGAGDCAGACVV